MQRIRLALFTNTYVPEINGVAITLERWVIYLGSQGIECKVFTPSRPWSERPVPGIAERIASIPFVLYPEIRLAVPLSAGVERKLLDFKPTLIHVRRLSARDLRVDIWLLSTEFLSSPSIIRIL
jgi:hypothetical protein